MKKYLLLLLLIPVIGMSQSKTVLTGNRLFAKNDKSLEFEKALATHAQKYHTGDVKWRVWTIESGPDAGGYMISEGPTSWSLLDGRGDLGTEHMNDWAKNVMPLTMGQGQSAYSDFLPDLSTVQLTDYADKIVITHIIAKPGMPLKVRELIQKLKKVWEAGNESVAVYSIAASGDPGFTIVNRLKGGLKEMASDYRKPMPERYNAIFGAGAYDIYLKDYADAVQSRFSEILMYKASLSSK